MEKCDVAILIFEITVNYLTAHVKTYLVAVLYGIAYLGAKLQSFFCNHECFA